MTRADQRGARAGALALAALALAAAGCDARVETASPPRPPPARDADPPSPRATWRAHQGAGFALAAPDASAAFAAPPPAVLALRLAGRGIPRLDGTLAALAMTLTVERPESAEAPPDDAETIALADGTAARIWRTRHIDERLGRLIQTVTVSATGPDGRPLLARALVVSSPAAERFVAAIGAMDFVAAHARSLVLDADALDEAALAAAYERLDWRADAAIQRTVMANAHMDTERSADAIAAYEDAIGACDHLSAAHNGLAWTLLTASDGALRDPERALAHARRAVEQTERRDADALDTLALALFETGDRDGALATIDEALAIAPDDRELLASRERFRQSR